MAMNIFRSVSLNKAIAGLVIDVQISTVRIVFICLYILINNYCTKEETDNIRMELNILEFWLNEQLYIWRLYAMPRLVYRNQLLQLNNQKK